MLTLILFLKLINHKLYNMWLSGMFLKKFSSCIHTHTHTHSRSMSIRKLSTTSTQGRSMCWLDTVTSFELLQGWMIRGNCGMACGCGDGVFKLYRFITASDDATAIVWNMEVCCFNLLCCMCCVDV